MTQPQTEVKQGRPAPVVERRAISLNLDVQIVAALDACKTSGRDVSQSAAATRLLRKALSLDE